MLQKKKKKPDLTSLVQIYTFLLKAHIKHNAVFNRSLAVQLSGWSAVR